MIHNDEMVKFYSPFPNKNNKEGSGENCCCELFSLPQMEMGACVMGTRSDVQTRWLAACTFVLVGERVVEGELSASHLR